MRNRFNQKIKSRCTVFLPLQIQVKFAKLSQFCVPLKNKFEATAHYSLHCSNESK